MSVIVGLEAELELELGDEEMDLFVDDAVELLEVREWQADIHRTLSVGTRIAVETRVEWATRQEWQ